MTALKTQAIQTALCGDWQSAVDLNRLLLINDPNDIETLNRLAFALTVLGKTKDARTTYQKVLDLDEHNPIAIRGLKRLKETHVVAGKGDVKINGQLKHPLSMFLEEAGKTKVIELVNVAEPKIISLLRTGEFVTPHVKRLKIFVLDEQNQYIGMLPDDIGKRLIKFLKGGNCYETYVKSVANRRVSIFIREIKRATRFKNQPSFISGGKNTAALNSSSKSSESEKETFRDPLYL